ncbi:transglutaminase-like putative cysteine protease [Jatrophihabitans sp. GAS493]|uniref:transglutaminase family protein n=1 Tax=Jatrophihabitans sp. GAS493 TaxID=1907575 RepID=UPI000BB6F29F|nr:transglutaminase family protein [Jatrophihabitans sp. GAS493]SOD75093.1 transglutaminase-like putative cysteine protease [Jatrophihabitans sp. GAS493]
MTSRMRVRHSSRYEYDAPVTASFNETRLTPLVLPWQNPLETLLNVDADGQAASWQHAYSDYWGTWVRAFEVQAPHSSLNVEAVSLVEVNDAWRPKPDLEMSWDSVRADSVYQRFGEYLTQTARTEPNEELSAIAVEVGSELAPHQAALALCNRVRETVTYVPGSTGVNTSATQSWEAGTGVCQDYAHIVVGALRHIGLPARYVSGYMHPDQNAALGEPVKGESHAWVQWWLGEWIGHDPTNDSPISERHVLVGTGRDYTDAPPIKGLVAGSATSELSVSVEITRLA